MEIPLTPDGRPDVEKLIAKIEKEATDSINANGYSMPRYFPVKASIDPQESPQYSAYLSYLNHHWNDWFHLVGFQSHRKFIGPIILKAKNFIQGVVNVIFHDYLQKEISYQENLVRYLNQSSKYVDERDAQIFWSLNEKVDSEVKAVNTRTDELFDRLACEILELKEKIARLESEKRKVA